MKKSVFAMALFLMVLSVFGSALAESVVSATPYDPTPGAPYNGWISWRYGNHQNFEVGWAVQIRTTNLTGSYQWSLERDDGIIVASSNLNAPGLFKTGYVITTEDAGHKFWAWVGNKKDRFQVKGGLGKVDGWAETDFGVPNKFILNQNHPNPFNPSTTISYQLPEDCQVTLKIYDISGHQLAILVNERQPAGFYSLNWSANDRPSGIYLAVLQAGKFRQQIRMVLKK